MREWICKNRQAFERDVLQDFCQVSERLFEQIARFDKTRTISFPVLSDMIGKPLNKGLLWRLKDKSHHIFMGMEDSGSVSLLLDWTLGYIFHETLKLMEDAHQRQFYAPRLRALNDHQEGPAPEASAIAEELHAILAETSESMRRELERIANLLRHSRKLFVLYFAGASAHRPLARFLHDNTLLAQRAFAEDFDRLMRSVYADEPERLHIEAAHSLFESARNEAAAKALQQALLINPRNPEALKLQEEQGA